MILLGTQVLSPLQLLRGPVQTSLPYPLGAAGARRYLLARNGIYDLFRCLAHPPGSNVVLPAYHSGNEVLAIRAAGVTPRFYSIDRALQPSIDEIESLCDASTCAVYLIHFLGWPQPVGPVAELCRRRGLLLVEDCALALLSSFQGRPLGTFGDYSVFCLYKTLPVPNGGYLACNRPPLPDLDAIPIQPCPMGATARRTIDLLLGWLRLRVGPFAALPAAVKSGIGSLLRGTRLRGVPVGDMGFALDRAHLGIGRLTEWLLRRFDYARIVEIRRRNYARLAALLEGRATLLPMGLEEGVCPLFFPVLVRDKGAAAQALRRQGVGAIEFWNSGDPEADTDRFPDAAFLRRHLLELPIHQDISPRQIDRMAEILLRLAPWA
ncbi:MAG: DegT/DnrJ/EryC1/StrS family aminotransferase [Planctomycetaceae bacterium]